MAEKKSTSKQPDKKKIGRAPSLNERITDFSKGGFVGKPIWGEKKGKKK